MSRPPRKVELPPEGRGERDWPFYRTKDAAESHARGARAEAAAPVLRTAAGNAGADQGI